MNNLLLRYSQPKHTNNIYHDYCVTGKEQNNLPLSEIGKQQIIEFKFPNTIKTIYYSPCGIARSTAEEFQRIHEVEIQSLDLLANIKHDFSEISPQENWTDGHPSDEHMKTVRKKFIEMFFKDQLIDKRIDTLETFKQLHTFLETSSNSLFITHGIVLTLFRLYILTKFTSTSSTCIKLAETNKPFYGSLKGYFYNEVERTRCI